MEKKIKKKTWERTFSYPNTSPLPVSVYDKKVSKAGLPWV